MLAYDKSTLSVCKRSRSYEFVSFRGKKSRNLKDKKREPEKCTFHPWMVPKWRRSKIDKKPAETWNLKRLKKKFFFRWECHFVNTRPEERVLLPKCRNVSDELISYKASLINFLKKVVYTCVEVQPSDDLPKVALTLVFCKQYTSSFH